MKHLTLHCLASSQHRCQHYIQIYAEIGIKMSKTFQHICKGNDNNVSRLCCGNNKFFLEIANGIHASSLLCVNIFIVKALRQWRQIREAMKQWNVNYGKKLKQWSDEAFNAGKEIEAMKRLTLHCITSLHHFIASSLHRFIASIAQLWLEHNFHAGFGLATVTPNTSFSPWCAKSLQSPKKKTWPVWEENNFLSHKNFRNINKNLYISMFRIFTCCLLIFLSFKLFYKHGFFLSLLVVFAIHTDNQEIHKYRNFVSKGQTSIQSGLKHL